MRMDTELQYLMQGPALEVLAADVAACRYLVYVLCASLEGLVRVNR